MKIKSSEKDQLIAELRQQLYELKNQDRDTRAVHDEIISTENKYKMVSDDKVRGDLENRARLDRDMDEIHDVRKQIDELKYLLSEKSKQNMDLQDEFVRSKRMLDERQYEAGKLSDECVRNTEQNMDLRDRAAGLEREIDALKAQRADNWREISRLKDGNDQKMKEQADQGERIKALDYDLSRSQARVDDLQKLIDGRNYELRNKEMLLEDAQRELHRVSDDNNRLNGDNGLLRSDIDRQTQDNYELRKQLEYNESKNADLGSQARNLEARLRDREDQAYALRRDLEASRGENTRLRSSNVDQLAEKEALEKHASVLNDQNNGLNKELDAFIQTDEVVRSQLDRRGRVQGMRSNNEYNLQKSYANVEEARSRSPQRRW